VLRTLEKEPDRRYQQASQVRTEVETIAAGAANPESRSQKPEGGAQPKVSLCYVSTPEYLRTFRGRFFNIYQGKGELCLDSDALRFRSGWQAVTIPLSSIQSLALGEYPSSAKPVPLHFIAVTFTEYGVSRTLLFTPVRTDVMFPTEANRFGQEWLSAIQEAIRACTGRMPSVGHLDVAQDATGWEYVRAYGRSFLLAAACFTLTSALMSLILEQRLPNRLSDWMWAPIAAAGTIAITVALLHAMRRWGRLTPAGGNTAPALRWRDRWLWDNRNGIAWRLVLLVLLALLLFTLWMSIRGESAGYVALLSAPAGAVIGIYGWVGHRIRRLKSTLSPGQAEVAEGWLGWSQGIWPFNRSQGLAILHSDRLELVPIWYGSRVTVPLVDIISLREVRWVYVPLFWKRGLVLELTDGERVRLAVPEPYARRWRAPLSGGRLPELPAQSAGNRQIASWAAQGEPLPRWVPVFRWMARLLGTLCILLLIPFVLAEGLPPLTQQPEGVQLTSLAGFLLVLGFVIGWWREGTAALLIAAGWTLFNVSENRIEWGPFHGVLIIAAAYACCWWATRGRRTGTLAMAVAALAAALVLGRLLCPTSVFVTGLVTDAVTGHPISNAELILADPRRPPEAPNARTSKDGRYSLYVGWYSEQRNLRVSAQGYAGLVTSLGPRPLGRKRLNRDLRLTPAFGPVKEVTLHAKGADGQEVLDLDTGQILPLDLPKELVNAPSKTDLVQWMADRGVDLAFEFESRSPLPVPSYLCTTDLLLVLRSDEEWEAATEATLSLALAQGAPGVRVEHQGPVKAYCLEAQTKLPLTFAFKTAQGSLGLLQVTELIDKPRSVKIRYRLVQTQEGSTQAPALASKASAEGDGTESGGIGAALQFRLVAADEDSYQAVDLLADPLAPSNQAPLRVLRQVLMDESAVAGADMTFEPDGRRSVSVKLTDVGSRQFGEVTGRYVKRRLAIVFRGRVVSAPVIQAPITGGRLMITGGFSTSETHEMVDALNRAARPTEQAWTLAGPFEVVLPWVGQEPNFVLYDLDTDRWTTNRIFRPDLREFHEWLCSVGADVVALGREPELPFVTGYDMVFAAAPDQAWDVVTAGDLVQCMALNDVLPRQEIRRAKAPGEADTFLFRTREDGRGLLQILGFSGDRKGVKIRYARIQAAADRPAPGH